MTTEKLTCIVNEVVMKEVEVDELDLCLICCSKVKSEKDQLDNINCQLLSNNLIVFYLVRRVLQVNANELKNNLISCGNPMEWIRLCDKCSELTRQAEQLHRKLRKIERELSCVQQLIWDKARLSIKSEDDRKLVEATIEQEEQTGTTAQVRRRIRNHVANKCQLTKRNVGEEATLINPFIEGDKLANCFVTQNASNDFLPCQLFEQNANVEQDPINLLEETNFEATSYSLAPPRIKMEVTADELEPQLADTLDHQNYDNLLIDNLLGELDQDVKVELDDQVEGGREEDANLKENERGGNKVLVQEQLDDDKVGEEGDVDWHWEPDDENHKWEEDNDEVDEYVQEESLSKMKGPPPPPTQKRRRSMPPPPTEWRKYRKMERTEDGKYKCRYCDQTFVHASGCNGHERSKHPKTPGAFICSTCGRPFNSRDYLRKHTTRNHKLTADGFPTL